jgi:hypothetical protein
MITGAGAVRAIWGMAGGLVVLGTFMSEVRTLVVPRVFRPGLSNALGRVVYLTFQFLADRFDRYETKDRILAYAGPLSVVVKLVGWLGAFLVGYSMLNYSVADLSWRAAAREAGSSLFTLGFASVDKTRLNAVDFAAAVTGPVSIGLLVGYIPALYAAYARRETEVTMLEARAGGPAWGPEILARYAMVNLNDQLPDLYRGWERWTADVSESHTSYPVLIYFRSPRAHRNWLIALLAVLDAAALHVSFNPSQNIGEIRMALRSGFVTLREIARTERVPYNPDPSPEDPITLTYDEFLYGVQRMRAQGYEFERTPEEAWPHFKGWRVNYEAVAYALAHRIDAVPARWSGPRRSTEAQIDVITPVNRQPGGAGVRGITGGRGMVR